MIRLVSPGLLNHRPARTLPLAMYEGAGAGNVSGMVHEDQVERRVGHLPRVRI